MSYLPSLLALLVPLGSAAAHVNLPTLLGCSFDLGRGLGDDNGQRRDLDPLPGAKVNKEAVNELGEGPHFEGPNVLLLAAGPVLLLLMLLLLSAL